MREQNKTNHNLAILILCGGAGTRVENKDKGLINYRGKPLVLHTIETFKPYSERIIISANRNIDQYRQFGFEIVSDTSKEPYSGPIAGILSAASILDGSQNVDHLLVSPCDTPNLDKQFVERMLASVKLNQVVTAAHDGVRRQNLHCILHRDSLHSLQEFYNYGGRAIKEWQNQNNVVEVDLSDCPKMFANLNQASDFA